MKSVAYLALVAEATDVTTRLSKEVGALYLRSRILNFEDRKIERIEFFAERVLECPGQCDHTLFGDFHRTIVP